MKLILSTPLTLIASPLASSTAKSRSVTPFDVTESPWAPESWFLKDKIVLFIPSPSRINPSISIDKLSSS